MDVIIIGAGASGLMAAKALTNANKKVLVLEARNRIGGRINTIDEPGFIIETGAEFIHGILETTLQLLKQAGIKYNPVGGEMWQVENGYWKKENELFENAALVMERLKNLKEDISISAFLTKEFSEAQHSKLRESLTAYIEGYYAGDPKNTSAFSFYEEWQSEDEEQFRVDGGYVKLMRFLADGCSKAGNIIQLSIIVKEVRWTKGKVEVIDQNGKSYSSGKLLITVPTGVWLAGLNDEAAISFSPGIPGKIAAAKQLGNGFVIKIQLEFKNIFWENLNPPGTIDLEQFSFVFSGERIGTWWTQYPTHSPLLTGWLAGPQAKKLQDASEESIIRMAIESLSLIFSLSENEIHSKLKSSHVFNWAADPFTQGGYSYSTLNSKAARKIFLEPIEETLFFAGEALYEGTETGTVEAALVSGQLAAKTMLKLT